MNKNAVFRRMVVLREQNGASTVITTDDHPMMSVIRRPVLLSSPSVGLFVGGDKRLVFGAVDYTFTGGHTVQGFPVFQA